MEVKDYFEKLKKKINGDLKIESSSWFNGHAYFPFNIYQLNMSFENYSIKIEYEFKQSEFSKVSAYDGGENMDRNTCGIECFINSTNFSNLEIIETGFLARIRNKTTFKIKTIDDDFKDYLFKLTELKEIFSLSAESSDFSPQIIGKNKTENYYLSIRYSSVGFKENALNLILSLCNQISQYTKKR
jgi:hypothetical protein